MKNNILLTTDFSRNAWNAALYFKEEISFDDEQKNNKDILKNCLDGLEYSYHELENTNVLKGLKNFSERGGVI